MEFITHTNKRHGKSIMLPASCNWVNMKLHPDGTGYTEKGNLDMSMKFINSDSVIIDIGAAIGEYIVHWADLNPEIHAFEPQKDHLYCLYNNIKVNNVENIQVYEYGLGNKEETLKLIKSKGSPECASIHGKMNKNKIIEEIKIAKLDDFYLKPTYIKMDIEGHEMQALEGMERTLVVYKPVIQMEWKEDNLNRAGTSRKEIWDFLKFIGYNNPIDRKGNYMELNSKLYDAWWIYED